MARKRKEAIPHLRIRIEPGLLARLEKSRAGNSRTLTGEIVHRIEQTYRKSDDANLVTSAIQSTSGATSDLLIAIQVAIWLIERRTGKKWNEDRDIVAGVRVAMFEIATALSYTVAERAHFRLRHPAPPTDMSARVWEAIKTGKGTALEVLQKMGIVPSDAEIAEAGALAEAEAAEKEAVPTTGPEKK